ncbi:MAG: nucleotidyltransferase domain-containing protein [Candidatus Hydrogenedentes bacterium]|nr:nucleotidyltransferase domain-containing protein [Candidatus Hydrogenedentota bacterium]
MKTLDSATLAEITRRLVAECQPELIILFGSHAWGTPHASSDVDLLIIVPHSDLPPLERAVQARRCLRGLGVSKDVIVKTRAELEQARIIRSSLEYAALRQGKVLYERGAA